MIMYDNDNDFGVTAYPNRPGWVVTLDRIKTNEMVVTEVVKEIPDTFIGGDVIIFNDEFELVYGNGVYIIRPELPYIGTKSVSEYINVINTFRYRDRYKAAAKLYVMLGEFIQKHYLWEAVGIGCFRWQGRNVDEEVPLRQLSKKVRDMIPVTDEKDWVDIGHNDRGVTLVTINEYPVFVLIYDRHGGLTVSVNRMVKKRTILAGVKTEPLKE